ncbi:protein N-terminal asparagine amidohydrolase [Poecilia latipinna]|uniref:N-terminal asparagine amidase n=2 Tax=Poecilia TaxID=8080 RepID=A0A087Y1C1_POEFO|nr:PREDICTED: protein N-terminal asparagine amidohydrolase [Poecilia formosa]XP_014882007.1 PREDICTED: protein N-terminal asparagine amidohydrolase [Poecilia latipinna]
MPLFFQNRELDCFRSTAELFDKYPHLQENAKAFRSKPRVDVDPKHLLYVQQREFAATTPADNCVSILGSDDATTCHLVVLRHTGSGAVCLSHLDGSSTRTEVQLIMKAVTSLSDGCNEGRFELHLVGGFDDDDKRSHKLSLNILAAFQKQKDHIHLETCCITEMNNVVDKGIHKPIVYGIGVNVKTGEVFPASFPHKGPAEMLRSARTFTGGEMTDIYDSRHGLVRVGPCQWSPDLEIAFWLSQSDATILKYLSTSPFAEPPHFVQHIKSTIQFLLSHPNSNSLFPGGQPHLYHRMESGSWERLVQS